MPSLIDAMNAAASVSPLCTFPTKPQPSGQRSLPVTSSLFRPNRRRRHRRHFHPHPSAPTASPAPSPDRTVDLSLDLDDLSHRASAALRRLHRSSNSRLRRFLSSGADAYRDLSTSVHLDPSHRIRFSCRHCSLLFVADLLVWGVLCFAVFRALAWAGSGFRARSWWEGERPVVRRDRSLAGREVIIRPGTDNRLRVNPVSPARVTEAKGREGNRWKSPVRREQLPKWWRDNIASSVSSEGRQEYQIEANRLVRAIMDNRMSGKDFNADDIIQLRRICRVSGARVSFETTNARDSFYRAAVGLVFDSCSSGTVLIDGEEAGQFVCGLADNIGLENVNAAKLVRAAVAAHTRASLLQSWALEVQGRRVEALEELSKICRLFLVFPPEECSPEMEMVAGGLKKNLGVEHREHLMNLFKEICGAEIQRIAAEALGLLAEEEEFNTFHSKPV